MGFMNTAEGNTTGHVVLIGGGPGAWDLITVRGMRALQQADVILTDHLGPSHQLDELCDTSSKEIVDVAKLPYSKQVSQEKINELIVEYANQGKRVARLKGGDPFVFGRGFEEVQACAAAGLSCDVIPGVTSAVAVPALLGVPITQRGLVHAFTVVSGHLPPGHPKSLVDWNALAQMGSTISVIMGVKNAAAIATALIDGGREPETPVLVVQEGSYDGQKSLRTSLQNLGRRMAEEGIAAPAVYVIGEVAGLDAS